MDILLAHRNPLNLNGFNEHCVFTETIEYNSELNTVVSCEM